MVIELNAIMGDVRVVGDARSCAGGGRCSRRARLSCVVGALWGLGVFRSADRRRVRGPGQRVDPARDRITAEIGNQDVDIIVLYSSPTATVDDPAMRDR
jgi:hypothetical protein